MSNTNKLQIEKISPQQLKDYHRQLRVPNNQIHKTKELLSYTGPIIPVIIDDDNVVIVGWHLAEAARQLSLDSIPSVRISHLDETQLRVLRVAYDRVAEEADWDKKALAEEFSELKVLVPDLTILGFDLDEINICLYTRKSTDERLEMEFNTLDAQREACAAYIMSQRSEGWIESPVMYDDGGFSGGTLTRPSLERLISDIKAGKVNIIVVYKIDRLTRSLTDFAKLVDIFDQYGVTFVSVTQSFNTTTSMGRLTLNVLLSFAQFEREVSGERIRDKIAASKAKGMWQGGRPPFGFDIGDRRLITNEEDARTALAIFELYLQVDGVHELAIGLRRRGVKSRQRISQRGHKYGGAHFSRGALHSMLTNPVYIGKIRHIDTIHEGLHDAIISQQIWDKVQNKLQEKAPFTRGQGTQRQRNLLTGLIFDQYDRPYTPVFTSKKSRKYRYYCNKDLARNKQHPDHLRARFPAHEIEAVIEQAVRAEVKALSGETSGTILTHVLRHQDVLPCYELIHGCVKRIVVHFDYLIIHFKPDNFKELVDKYLRVSVNEHTDEFTITIPFQTKRGRDGAVIIESEERDILDLPPEDLKRLVQGIAWRDEHFAGTYIKDIATRENYSDRYVRNQIMASFETLR